MWGSVANPVGWACLNGTRNEPNCEKATILNYCEALNRENVDRVVEGEVGEWNDGIVGGTDRTEYVSRRGSEDWVQYCAVLHEGTLVWPENPMISASTDGVAILQTRDGKWDCFMCEWKCPLSAHGYRSSVPIEYMYQMQIGRAHV